MDTPLWLQAFVDDAAIFPPARTPLDQAVTEHVAHRSAEYAGIVGGFVVSDVKVADLANVVQVVEQRAKRVVRRDHWPSTSSSPVAPGRSSRR